jgi:hypothetical protein
MLDAGPLVLLLGGTLRPDKVGTGRRFGKYNKPMYDRLLAEVNGALGHISLPNILTEASNHLGSGKQEHVDGGAAALAAYAKALEELYLPSERVVEEAVYFKVGLTDAAIFSCRARLVQDRVRVYTEDFELYQRLCSVNVDCVNIMHWRTPSR